MKIYVLNKSCSGTIIMQLTLCVLITTINFVVMFQPLLQ